jgi:hypothetical protein
MINMLIFGEGKTNKKQNGEYWTALCRFVCGFTELYWYGPVSWSVVAVI